MSSGPFCPLPSPSVTPTITETPVPTPTSPPGGDTVCEFRQANSYAFEVINGGDTHFDSTGFYEPYPYIQLAYNNAAGTSTMYCGVDFGFTVPPTATVIGIYVNTPLRALPNGLTSPFLPVSTVCDSWNVEGVYNTVQLRDETGTRVGTNKSDGRTLSNIGGFFGGPTDLWGVAWTPTKINSSAFGVCARAVNWTSSTDQTDCDLYHIVSSGNPALFPQVQWYNNLTVCYTTPE